MSTIAASTTAATISSTTSTTFEETRDPGDPALIAGEWLVTYTGLEQYPEQLFFHWQPGDRWGSWRYRLTPVCPDAGCPVSLTATNTLYGPDDPVDLGEMAFADGAWTVSREQTFDGSCLPSTADWTDDGAWHADAFTGSDLELTVVPIGPLPVDPSMPAPTLEITRVETGIMTEEATAVCDVATYSRSIAEAVPAGAGPQSILPRPGPQVVGALAVAHETAAGTSISLLDVVADPDLVVDVTERGVLVEGGTYPEWSPDGTMLAYTITSAEGAPETWVVASDGTEPRLLARGYEPSWSPDGTMITVRRDAVGKLGWTDIYAVLLPGGQIERVTYGGWTGDSFWLPPARLAVHDRPQFAYWTMTFSGFDGFVFESDDALLVDVVGEAHLAGDRIIYAHASELSPEFGAPRLHAVDVDGTDDRTLSAGLAHPDGEYSVAPDGSFLVTSRGDVLRITRLEEGDTRTVSRFSGVHSTDWSPMEQ